MKEMRADIFIVLGVLCAALTTFFIWYGGVLFNRERQIMTGRLITTEIDFKKPFEVNFGSNILIQTISQPNEGINLTKFISYGGYDYPIQIKFKDSKLLISAEIKNKDGITVAKIVNNDWIVNENKMIARDRNYNDYAFEVINSDAIPVLQIYLRDQNKIYVGGLFYFPEGRMLATPNGIIINPSSEQVNKFIECNFKYPSERYIGQLSITETFLETPLGMATIVYGIATVVFLVLFIMRGNI